MGYSFNDFISDLQPVGVGIQDSIKGTVGTIGGTIQNIYSTIWNGLKGITDNLSMPLLLIGAAMLLFFMTKK